MLASEGGGGGGAGNNSSDDTVKKSHASVQIKQLTGRRALVGAVGGGRRSGYHFEIKKTENKNLMLQSLQEQLTSNGGRRALMLSLRGGRRPGYHLELTYDKNCK